MTKNDFCIIQCGLKNQLEFKNKKKFWPVLEAIVNPLSIDINIFLDNYALVFSSKTAVDFFYSEIFQKNLDLSKENVSNHDILKKCGAVYFVGEKSKIHFEKVFFKFFHNKPLFASKNMGMKNTIDEFNLTESREKLIFVSALVGKSKLVIEQTNFKFPVVFLPIYYLIPYRSDFLETQFKNLQMDNDKMFVFECRSGQILEQVVIFLLEYFSSDNILHLPKNICFSSFGQSTFDKVKKLYAQ